MLRKPYKKFHEIELNNYYTLETADTTFLVVESVLPYKSWFRTKEFTTAIKMLPINSNILFALAQVLKLKKTGEKVQEEMEKEEYFEILDVNTIRKQLKKVVDSAEQSNHRFNYRLSVNNETAISLIKEGYALLTTEVLGTYMNKQWLMRSDKNGVVRIVEVTLGGKPTKTRVVDIKFHTLNRNIAYKLVKILTENKKGAE